MCYPSHPNQCFILLQAQYRFLHEVALAYMSQFDTYANFQ